jgi:hypothetical protein
LRVVVLFSLVAASTALAQPFARGQKLLLWDGTLRGSPRVMGLAGSYVGIAEGAEGIVFTPAAAAAKDPHFESDFRVDLGGALHFLFPGAARQQDWDNDGQPEQVEGPFSVLGTQVLHSALTLQYKDFGLGVGFDLQNFAGEQRREGEEFARFYNLTLIHTFPTIAASFWKDQILIGVGVQTTHALLGYAARPPNVFFAAPTETAGYHGWSVQLGALWRPVNQDYRVGLTFRPNATAFPAAPDKEEVGGITLPTEVLTPGKLSIGGAYALGSGRHLNIDSPGGWEDLPEKNPDGSVKRTSAMMKFLFTVQFDVFFPVQGATTVNAFLRQPAFDALPAGDRVSLQIRAGIEKEVFLDRFRVRLGGYLEPPTTSTGPFLRPHVTFGGDLYLFKVGKARLALGLAFDFAPRYQNLSVAVMFWK